MQKSSSDFSLFSAPRCAFTWKRSYTLADTVRTTSLFPGLWRCLPVIYGAAWQEIRSYHRVTSWNRDWFSAVPPRFHRLFDLFDQSYFRLINLLTRGSWGKNAHALITLVGRRKMRRLKAACVCLQKWSHQVSRGESRGNSQGLPHRAAFTILVFSLWSDGKILNSGRPISGPKN